MKEIIKNEIYRWVRNSRLDDLLAEKYAESSFLKKFIPPPSFYNPDQEKKIQRNGVSFTIRPNDLVQWFLYADPSEQYGIQELVQLLDPQRESYVIFDIGANCGQFCLNAAQKLTSIEKKADFYAFEPNPYVFQFLSRNLKQNPHLQSSIHLQSVGLGEKPETLTIQMPIRNSGAGSILRDYQHEPNEMHEIEIDTLDDFVAEKQITHVDFIKLDVECFEPYVLKGGENTISTYKPDMFVEASTNCQKQSEFGPYFIQEYLWSFGYDLYLKGSEDLLLMDPNQIEQLTSRLKIYNFLATTKKGIA